MSKRTELYRTWQDHQGRHTCYYEADAGAMEECPGNMTFAEYLRLNGEQVGSLESSFDNLGNYTHESPADEHMTECMKDQERTGRYERPVIRPGSRDAEDLLRFSEAVFDALDDLSERLADMDERLAAVERTAGMFNVIGR